MATRLVASTFVITCVLLIALDVGFAWLNPLKRLNDCGLTGLNHYYVVAKLPEFLASPQHPNVIMTGSSLWLYPSVRCDDEMDGRQTRYDPAYTVERIDGCMDSRYFQAQLNNQTGGQNQVVNLGTAGALMSDQYIVLKKCIASCKKPKLVLCDISAREFLDNNQPDPAKTPVYLVLADFTGLGDILKLSRGFSDSCDYAFGVCSNFFRARRDLKTFLINLTATVSGHPSDLLAAGGNVPKGNLKLLVDKVLLHKSADRPIYKASANMDEDLKHYAKVYLPVNQKILNAQMDYFEKYLALAQRENIAVLCVEMPLTKRNADLLPIGERTKIHDRIRQLVTKYGAGYYKPNDTFTDADFEDSAHLNARGGKKFFDGLAQRVATDQR